jgi:GAF domain-containing protein
LRDSALLDTPTEESFDRLARVAAKLVGAPVALVTAVDRDRQFFKSCLGLPEPWATRRETPLTHSFCQHVVTAREPVLLTDARQDPRFSDNLATATSA